MTVTSGFGCRLTSLPLLRRARAVRSPRGVRRGAEAAAASGSAPDRLGLVGCGGRPRDSIREPRAYPSKL